MEMFARRAFEVTGLLLSIVALAFSVREYFEFEHQKAAYSKQTQNLLEIQRKVDLAASEATTRSIGEFPKNIPTIISVVKHACATLDIMADTASYGMISSPDDFFNYLHALENMSSATLADRYTSGECSRLQAEVDPKKRVHVRLLIYDQATLGDVVSTQFNEKTFDSLANSSKFQVFFHDHNIPQPSNYKDLVAAILGTSFDYARQLAKNRIEVRVSTQRYMVYVWMRDSAEAAFSLDYQGASKDDVEQELAFATKDANLTAAFQKIFEQEWKKSKEFTP